MKKAKLLSAILAGALLLSGCSESIENKLETADSYMSDKDYEEAVEVYEEILKADDENIDAYLGLAKAYEKMDDIEKAIEILQEGYEETDDNSLKKKINKYKETYIESSNNFALSFALHTEQFRTKADGARSTLKNVDKDKIYVAKATVSDGEWELTDPEGVDGGAAPVFGSGDKYFFSQASCEDAGKTPTADNCLDLYLKESFSDFNNGIVYLFFNYGCCVGCAVQMRTGIEAGGSGDDIADIAKELGTAMKREDGTRAIYWASGTPGISESGAVIGTYPAIAMS